MSCKTNNIQGVLNPCEIGVSDRRLDKPYLLALALACFLLFFLGLGAAGLIDSGDGYYSSGAREMIESGDFITPHLNYQVFTGKPILIYWLISSAYAVFGYSPFAARVWSATLATILSFVIYLTLRSTDTRRAGFIAAVLFASSPLVVTFARMSLTDMTFCATLGLALCGTCMSVIGRRRFWWALIYIAVGLAVLAKGPAGLILFGAGIVPFFLIMRMRGTPLRELIAPLHIIKGTLLFLVIAVPWYVAVDKATNGFWTYVFFVFENFGRFGGTTVFRNREFWFYLPVVAYGFAPWVLILPSALAWGFNKWRTSDANDQLAKTLLLMAVWSAAIFLFFSFSQTKLKTYILPIFPSLAMLCGMYFDRTIGNGNSRTKTLKVFSTVIAAAGVLVLFLVPFWCALLTSPALAKFILAERAVQLNSIPDWTKIAVFVGLLLVGTLFILQRFFLRGNVTASVAVLAAAMVSGSSIGSTALFRIFYEMKQADIDSAARSIVALDPANTVPVAVYLEFRPAIFAIIKRPVDSFYELQHLDRLPKGEHPPQYILASGVHAQELLNVYQKDMRVISHHRQWHVIATNSLRVRRLPTMEVAIKKGIRFAAGRHTWGTLPFGGGIKRDPLKEVSDAE